MFQPLKLNQVAHRKSNAEDATATSDNPATTFQNPSVSCTDVGLTNMNLSNVVRRQNEIAGLLVLQQKHNLLPSTKIPVFDGDPQNFCPFMQAFEHGIEDNTDNRRDRLYYLEQFTSGQSKELVRSCLHMDGSLEGIMLKLRSS